MIQSVNLYLNTVGFGGLLYAIANKATRSSGLFELKRRDCRHPFSLRILSTDVPTYLQVFVNREYEFLTDGQPEVIVDAGANIGLASIYFANKFPRAKIIAIEPERSNFTLLTRNVAPYPQIVPVQAALWHKNEEIELIDPGLGKWGFMTEEKATPEALPGNACHAVTAMTVDRVMKLFDLNKIDIFKIDIEGAEREVFSDSSPWIGKVNSLIIELHEHMKAGCNRSFYCGSNGFDSEWQQGENVYLSRGHYLSRCS
ncbi:MAG TPA: FkbM family methyltransferase [Steroidobacteraceae bacterium]|nr:FkbM family methyltransferase [Steroidobacteraceae bacterium]